ncbi:MAG: LysR family transcriptional regulator [Lawsonibacter sp.]|nr:LysR family transcriptional regulator [Lawsonibacter sp.]
MTFENLEYFLVAAEELNFTKAAQKLFITQQSLSSHISKIEEYYGCRLFDRRPPLSLTPEGIELTQRVRELLSLANDTKRELQDMKDFRSSILTIGITRSRSVVYLDPVLVRYHEKYPNIRIKIMEGSAPEIEDALHHAKVDFSIGSPANDSYGTQSTPLWQERIVAAVPDTVLSMLPVSTQEQLILDPAHVDWTLLGECPFIALSPNLRSGAPFYSIFQELNIAPKIVLEAQSIDTLLPLCIDGIGILVCPDIFLYPYKKSGVLELKRIHLLPHSGEQYTNQVCINYLRKKYLSTAAKEFISMLKDESYSL